MKNYQINSCYNEICKNIKNKFKRSAEECIELIVENI